MRTRRDFLRPSFRSPARPAEAYWVHVSRDAMACRFEITLPMWEREGVALASQALDQIDALERQLTVFDERSEVSYLNRHAAERKVPLEASLFELVKLCQELNEQTAGAFDITSGPLTRCWGFLRREG